MNTEYRKAYYQEYKKSKDGLIAQQNQVVTTLGRFSNPRDAYIKRIENELSMNLITQYEYDIKLNGLDNFLTTKLKLLTIRNKSSHI